MGEGSVGRIVGLANVPHGMTIADLVAAHLFLFEEVCYEDLYYGFVVPQCCFGEG